MPGTGVELDGFWDDRSARARQCPPGGGPASASRRALRTRGRRLRRSCSPRVSIGLLAADEGGYFQGAWRLATPLYAAVVVAILASARDLRVPRAALAVAAGLAGLCAVDGRARGCGRPTGRPPSRTSASSSCTSPAAPALLLLANRGRGVAVAGGVVAATVAVSCYSMASRLYPGTFGMYTTGGRVRPPVSADRLLERARGVHRHGHHPGTWARRARAACWCGCSPPPR